MVACTTRKERNMASPKHCDDFEPHDSHEWHDHSDPVASIFGGMCYRCWGVKDDPSLAALRERREIIRNHAARIEAEYREAAANFLRTEAEFYLGDGASDEDWDV
jgi:hypothetical protein